MYFQIADMIPPVEGIDLGGRWNGWRRPAFTKASADAVVDAYNEFYEAEAPEGVTGPGPDGAHAWYDDAERSYFFYTPASEETERYVLERTHGGGLPPEGVQTWSIGTDGWTWEAAPVTRVTVTFDIVGGGGANDVAEQINDRLDEGSIQQAIDPDGEWNFLTSVATTDVLP